MEHPWKGRAQAQATVAKEAVELCTDGLDAALAAGDGVIDRALSNTAQAFLKLRQPALALGFALAAVRCQWRAVPRKAVHRAAVACAALRQPQAALYFLQMVCSLLICHCSAAPLRVHTFFDILRFPRPSICHCCTASLSGYRSVCAAGRRVTPVPT